VLLQVLLLAQLLINLATSTTPCFTNRNWAANCSH
jgi:hypothetical protein